jgi:hypothetical protein
MSCAWTDWKRRTPAMRKSREKMRLCNGISLDKKILSQLKRDHDVSTNHKVNKVLKNQTGRIHQELGPRFMFPSIAPKIRLLTTRAFPAESSRFAICALEPPQGFSSSRSNSIS